MTEPPEVYPDAMPEEPAGLAIRFTDEAHAKLSEVIDNHPNPVAGLRLTIQGREGGKIQHLLSLVEEGAQVEDDLEVDDEQGALRVFVSSRDAAYLDNIEIHYFDDQAGNAGLEFRNPNPLWSDPREFAIQQLFDEHINPQIAAHGGVISLLGVEGRTAYVEFGGGCVGCGMLNVTLKQGVEVAVKENVADIDEIVDVTDHQSGTNPYYKPSKK
jgi:IscR-regulated protein YhgI